MTDRPAGCVCGLEPVCPPCDTYPPTCPECRAALNARLTATTTPEEPDR